MFATRVNTLLRRIPVWLVYTIGLLPPPVLFWMGITGALGPEPVKALEHELGDIAIKLLIAGLVITPLLRFTGINLMRFRRSIGVLCFYHVACHLLVWLVLDVQILSEIWADILKRPYVTVGMASFLLLLPLAMTSNNWSVRRLGRKWRVLHKLVYGAALLGGLHYVMQTKGLQIEPYLYFILIVGLLAVRLPVTRRKSATRKNQVNRA